jgi:hypothetical protein
MSYEDRATHRKNLHKPSNIRFLGQERRPNVSVHFFSVENGLLPFLPTGVGAYRRAALRAIFHEETLA